MSMQELVRPDAIFSAGDAEEEEVNSPLDPCPACGARPHEAPEGIHDQHSLRKYPHRHGTSEDGTVADPLGVGDAKWVFDHCWKCGHRPGHNIAVSQTELRRQFAAFKKFMDEQNAALAQEKGMLPPSNQDEVNDLKAQLEEASKREAELRAKLEGGAS